MLNERRIPTEPCEATEDGALYRLSKPAVLPKLAEPIAGSEPDRSEEFVSILIKHTVDVRISCADDCLQGVP